jgi:hypothetical protein
MLDGGKTMRALRPSFALRREPFRDDLEQTKLERIRQYVARAAEGLPLFDEEEPATTPERQERQERRSQ